MSKPKLVAKSGRSEKPRLKISRPRLIKKFIGPKNQEWSIYHASRRHHPHLFRMEDGRSCHGITYFKGPRAHRIYIDSNMKPAQVFETSLHEFLHVALEDIGILYVVEEPIVDELAARVACILEQIA